MTRAEDIRAAVQQRLRMWQNNKFDALVDDTELTAWSNASTHSKTTSADNAARKFNAKLISGRLRQAVRELTSKTGGGVLMPRDIDAKTGLPVIKVLAKKHPTAREPGALALPEHRLCPDPMPLLVTQEAVGIVVKKMSGSAGLVGPDAEHLKDMCMRHGVASERLRDAIATLTEWMANEDVPWAACRALRACRLVALDKQPGVRPVGIGETISRLMSKIVLHLCGRQATRAAGNLNLCAGLPAGIEGAVHALRSKTQQGCPESRKPCCPDKEQTTWPPVGQPPHIELGGNADAPGSGLDPLEGQPLSVQEGSVSEEGGNPQELDPLTQPDEDHPGLIQGINGVSIWVGIWRSVKTLILMLHA